MMLNPKLLTSVIFAGAITLSGNTSNAPKDHMAISITAADAKVPFYARLTTGAKRLVLTSAAEATSETRKTFFLPRGHKAFVVEYLAPKGASPHGEQFRYANLGVLTAATFEEAETALHAIGEAAHPIEVSSELLVPSQNNSNLLAKFAPPHWPQIRYRKFQKRNCNNFWKSSLEPAQPRLHLNRSR